MNNFIFNIGLNRSGTKSLTYALRDLKIKSLHFAVNSDNIGNNSIQIEDVIKDNIQRKNKALYGLDDTYQGFSDFNGELYYERLYNDYPNSMFILTVRPFNDWVRSNQNNEIDIGRTAPRIDDLIKRYNLIKDIRNFFSDKSDKFLEIDICNGDGWDKLCNFLNLQKPNKKFPHYNKLTRQKNVKLTRVQKR